MHQPEEMSHLPSVIRRLGARPPLSTDSHHPSSSFPRHNVRAGSLIVQSACYTVTHHHTQSPHLDSGMAKQSRGENVELSNAEQFVGSCCEFDSQYFNQGPCLCIDRHLCRLHLIRSNRSHDHIRPIRCWSLWT